MGKVTVVGRRRQETVPEQYGVNIEEEETQGRLVQHVEGKVWWPHTQGHRPVAVDMDTISTETVQGLCTGANVFYCTLGTTRSLAGSAVRSML